MSDDPFALNEELPTAIKIAIGDALDALNALGQCLARLEITNGATGRVNLMREIGRAFQNARQRQHNMPKVLLEEMRSHASLKSYLEMYLKIIEDLAALGDRDA